jgi:glucans biosynthesis protein C
VPTRVRLRETDALRAALVYGVVIFHSVRVFDPFDFTVKAETESVLAGAFVLFVSLWGMPLFFVLAGYGIWHSLGHRSPAAFARERLARLAVPLAFGLLVIVPPQVHVDRLVAGERPSLADTWTGFWELSPRAELPWPLGGPLFDLAHLWFLAYLLVFSLLLLPVLGRLRGGRGTAIARRLSSAWVLMAVVAVVALFEVAFGSEDAGGWNRWAYPVCLLLGFLLAAHPAPAAALARRWRALLGAGLLLFLPLLVGAVTLEERLGDGLLSGGAPEALAWRAGKAVVGVLLVAGVAGAAAAAIRHRRRQRRRFGPRAQRIVAYGNETAIAVYVLHQTVTVLIAYELVDTGWPAGAQWAALACSTLLVTVVAVEAVRRVPLARVLLGLRPRGGERLRSSVVGHGLRPDRRAAAHP